jgi:hypothetical protein
MLEVNRQFVQKHSSYKAHCHLVKRNHVGEWIQYYQIEHEGYALGAQTLSEESAWQDAADWISLNTEKTNG